MAGFYKRKRNTRIHNHGKTGPISEYPFVRITATGYLNINVYASDLLGVDTKRADLWINEDDNICRIVRNDASGEYAVTRPRNRNNLMLCIMSLLTDLGNVDISKRYEVTQIDNGIEFKFERG